MRARYTDSSPCSCRTAGRKRFFKANPNSSSIVQGPTVSGLIARSVRLSACVTLVALIAAAHEARPAYLEIKETNPGRFQVLWRTPVMAGMFLPVVLKLPADARNLREPSVQELSDSLVERRWVDLRTERSRGQAHRVQRTSDDHHGRAGTRGDA